MRYGGKVFYEKGPIASLGEIGKPARGSRRT